MNLFVFPQAANLTNGYSIVVNEDFIELKPGANDIVVWYTNDVNNLQYLSSHITIKRPTRFATKRVVNVLKGRPSTELLKKDLSFIQSHEKFDMVYVGDTIAYRVLRNILPKAHLTVRFHNSFYRISERLKRLNYNADLKYGQVLQSFKRLETLIFKDENMTPVFLCSEDLEFYQRITGRSNAKLWNVKVDESKFDNKIFSKYKPIDKLIYFGGVDTHKKKSIDYFSKHIFSKLKNLFPNLTFELYGSGTEVFNDRKNGVFGRGRYEGDDFPSKFDSLYINPDLTGGGVKIKIKSYLENNLRFLTTPFGYEGYSSKYIDDKNRFSRPMKEWSETILDILKTNNNLEFN